MLCREARSRWAGVAIAAAAAFLVASAPAGAAIPVHYAADTDSPYETFFAKGGLRLKGACDAGGNLLVKVVSHRNKRGAGLFHANSQSAGNANHYFGVEALHRKTDGFDLLTELEDTDSMVGQIVYAERRSVVTMDWLAEVGAAPDGVCTFGGTALKAREGSESAIIFRAREGKPAKTVADLSVTKLRAECASNAGPDLNLSVKNGLVTSSTFAGSQSDFNSNGSDEAGFRGIIGLFNDEAQVDTSGVAGDHAVGQLVVNTSNSQVSVDYAVSSSGGLGRDCVFAGIARQQDATAGDRRPVYSTYTVPDGPDTFFSRGGLEMTASCSAASDLSLEASSPDADAIAHWGIQSDANGDTADTNQYFEVEPLDAVGGPVLDASEDEKAIVEMVYRLPGGSYTTADFIADESGIFGGANCAVAGTSEVAGA